MDVRLREHTMYTKRYIIDLKIRPYFEKKILSEITVADVRAWQNELLMYKDKNGKGYSQTYLKTINCQLTAIFNYAIRYYNLQDNPCRKAEAIGKSKGEPKDFWMQEEFNDFLETVSDKPETRMAFLLLYWSGMRIGELLALIPLYEHLSRDDELQGESNSISNQKQMLEDFARPGFLAIMEEVEAGRVEAIVIKDMSRLGRDYLKVGQVMEVLRQRGVRLIAINDGVDSLKGDDDFTPFRNIMNEFYARDISRKIRFVFKSKGMSGKHLTGTVIYGYLWDEKREHWLVDEEAAEVVRRIFSLTLE